LKIERSSFGPVKKRIKIWRKERQRENKDLEKELEDFYDSLPTLLHTGHEGEIDDVMKAIETGGKPLITGESGRLTIELITAIYKAGFEHKTVELPITAQDEYYTVKGIQKNAIHFYEKTASITELGSGEEITVGSNYKDGKEK
jgi:hypothetical protein